MSLLDHIEELHSLSSMELNLRLLVKKSLIAPIELSLRIIGTREEKLVNPLLETTALQSIFKCALPLAFGGNERVARMAHREPRARSLGFEPNAQRISAQK
jgi:hypothetical protein